MIIVSNTSPISNLAKVGQLVIVQQLYGKILIPCAVREELLDDRVGGTVIEAVQSATWLGIQAVQNQELVNKLRIRLNVGEDEAIALETRTMLQSPHIAVVWGVGDRCLESCLP